MGQYHFSICLFPAQILSPTTGTIPLFTFLDEVVDHSVDHSVFHLSSPVTDAGEVKTFSVMAEHRVDIRHLVNLSFHCVFVSRIFSVRSASLMAVWMVSLPMLSGNTRLNLRQPRRSKATK